MTSSQNPVCNLLNIEKPIIQAGMIWCSGWKLAAAVSHAGGLGTIGSGSMRPEVLREHITQCQAATAAPFAVNIPLLYPYAEAHVQSCIELGVKVVITSAGNPATWTQILKAAGITVIHVIANTKFALKAEAAGVDALVAEGFEAGGHNGREETTTMVLIPLIRKVTKLPLIAAGGIGSGQAMAAAIALGADAVQIGSAFLATPESSAHQGFKDMVLAAKEGDTELMMKELTPVRLLKNPFYQAVKAAELRGASKEELQTLLGKGRSRIGMFEGDLNEGELEVGQVAAHIQEMMPAGQLVDKIWQEFQHTRQALAAMNF